MPTVWLVPQPPIANSTVLDLATGMAPAARKTATTGASRSAGGLSLRVSEPERVGTGYLQLLVFAKVTAARALVEPEHLLLGETGSAEAGDLVRVELLLLLPEHERTLDQLRVLHK